jgi:membrane protein
MASWESTRTYAKDLWKQHHVSQMAASLSYYVTISLPPLCLLVLILLSLIFSEEESAGYLVSQAQTLVGKEGAEVIRTITQTPPRSFSHPMTWIVGIGLLLFGASSIFHHIYTSLNILWEHSPQYERPIVHRIVYRLPSLFMMLISSALILLATVVTISIPSMTTPVLPLNTTLIISFIVLLVSFALIYKILPHAAELSWKHAAIGAALSSILFVTGKAIFGLYIDYSQVTSAFGIFGSLIALLIWIYYSSLVLFAGAVYTRAVTLATVERTPSSPILASSSVSPSPASIDEPMVPTHDTGKNTFTSVLTILTLLFPFARIFKRTVRYGVVAIPILKAVYTIWRRYNRTKR